MARGKRHHRRGGSTIPLAVVAGFAPGLLWAFDSVKQGNWEGGLQRLEAAYVAYDPWGNHFSTQYLWKGLYPAILGFVIHGAASKFGINRAIARARIPWIRI